MPTNANTFNSRVTSEALEAKFRDVFPAQGGAELVQDLFASGVIQPVVDFSSVAEGSVLPQNLQTAWDFATGNDQVINTSTTVINNTGFWQVDLNVTMNVRRNPAEQAAKVYITDGLTTKNVWSASGLVITADSEAITQGKFVVFLRSGDSLVAQSTNTECAIDIWYRQIADVNGTLVNPLGFVFT